MYEHLFCLLCVQDWFWLPNHSLISQATLIVDEACESNHLEEWQEEDFLSHCSYKFQHVYSKGGVAMKMAVCYPFEEENAPLTRQTRSLLVAFFIVPS